MKNIPILLAIVFAFCSISNKAHGQCAPDTTDVCGSVLSITGLPASVSCTGAAYSCTPTIMVPAPLTLESYTWSPAVTSHSTGSVPGGVAVTTTINTPATATTTTYCLTAKAYGPSIITNGDFEDGNTCFGTDYTPFVVVVPIATYMPADNYTIGTTTGFFGNHPGTVRCAFNDHTTGTGNMMIVNGTALTPVPDVWRQTVNVCPGQRYKFSMFCKNWTNVGLGVQSPNIEVLINGASMGITSLGIGCAGPWQEITFIWNAGAAAVANITIRDNTADAMFNDFVIDDISMRRIDEVQQCITITPLPTPIFTLTPSVSTACSGDPFTITSSFAASGCPGCTMVWGGGASGMSGDPITITEYTTSPYVGYYTYTVTNSFGCSATQTATVNIDPPSDAGILRLPMPMGVTICSGFSSPISRLGGMPGGSWSTTAPVGVATVSPTGVITFDAVLVPTTITVFYSVTSGVCPPDVAFLDITVYPKPIFTVIGPTDICSGNAPTYCATVTPTSTGGAWTNYTWSSGATTSPCATLPGISTPYGMSFSENLTITNSYGCSATSAFGYSVHPLPDAGILRLPMPIGSTICSGFSSAISRLGGMPGGTWSITAPPGVATVSLAGVITFGTVLVPTTVTVFYTVTTTFCGDDVASLDITVYPKPMFTIVGASALCTGSFPSFCATPLAPTTGADWTTYAWSTGATTGPCMGMPAVFTPFTTFAGSLTITNSYGCSAANPFGFTVYPTPNPRIVVNPSPSPHLCVGDATLIYGLPGYTLGTFVETWTSSNSSVATVTATGPGAASIVGVSPGTATITYTVTDPATGCSGFATFNITIYSTPAPISGPSVICLGSSVTLSSTTPGGFWSSSDPVVADVVPDASNDGIVTGLSLGTSIISYTLNHEHVKCPATMVVTVVPTPKPSIRVNPSPSPYLCVGETTLIYGLPGYTGTYTEAWTSSDVAIATVTPPSGSVATITGISPGTAIITYTVTDPITLCSNFATFTVTIFGVPPALTGAVTICEGSTFTLIKPTTGGVWSSNNPAIADVVADPSGDGLITGITGGTAVISYSLMHGPTSCAATIVATVIPMPTGVCPTWYNDPILGPVFVIGGTPTGATVTYDCLDPLGNILPSIGTTTTGSVVSSYPLGTITLCVTSVTYMGCPFPIHCCVTFNGGSPKPAASVASNEGEFQSTISVIPNPNKGTFSLSGIMANVNANDQVKIEVIDLLGKVVQTEESTHNNGTISKNIVLNNSVANGVYIIKLTCGNKSEFIRCVLNK